MIGKYFLQARDAQDRLVAATRRSAVMRSPAIRGAESLGGDRAAHVGGQVAADLVVGVRSSSSSGRSVSHRLPGTCSWYVQRGRNTQPLGSRISDGGWPGIGSSRVARPASMRGTDASRPQRVGHLRAVVDVVDRAVLDDAAAVHHDDVVGHVGHDAEVVGDQDDRGAELALQVAAAGRGSAPAR